MATRDVSQLILQVSASTAVAQRQLNDLARAVAANSNDIDKSLGKVEQAHTKLGSSFNNSRIAMMELQHVARGSADQFAAGAAPTQIFAQHIAMLAEAGALAGGSLGKFGAFLAGQWGLALTVGVSVLAALIAKHHEAGNSVDDLLKKMREHAVEAQNSAKADDIWAHSIDGLIDRNQKLTEELRKRLKAEEDVELQQLNAANRDKAAAQEKLQKDQSSLAELIKRQEDAANNPGAVSTIAGGFVHGANPELAEIAKQIKALKEEILKDQQAIVESEAAIKQATVSVGEEQGKAAADATAAVDLWAKRYLAALHGIENNGLAGFTEQLTAAFETLKKAMGDAAGANLTGALAKARTQAKDLGVELEQKKISVAQYSAEVKKLAASLEAAAQAAKDAKKGAGEFGKQISFTDAENIAKGAGLTVTSGYRSTAHQAEIYNNPAYNHPGNPVARPGTSAHEGVNGKWALDIAFAPGLTPERLKKIYGDQGVTLSAVYKETGHFHIEGSRSQAASAERQAQAAQNKQIRDDAAFQRESDQYDAEILAAKQQMAVDFHQQADFAVQQVESEKQKQIASIDAQEKLGQISHTEADILRTKADQLATIKEQNVRLKEALQALNEQDQDSEQAAQIQQGHLQFQDSIARTAQQHQRIQLEILDLVYQEKEKHLETLKAQAELAGNTEEAARLQKQINDLPQQKAESAYTVHQSNKNPLQQWQDQVPQTRDEIIASLQQIEVQGLDGLSSAIAGVVSGTESMGDAFRQIVQQMISQLTALIIKMLLFKAIQAATGSGGMDFGLGAGLAGGAGMGAASFGSGAGMDFGLGAGLIGGGGAFAGAIPAFADGGSILLGGSGATDTNMLSFNGRPMAKVSRGETLAIIPQASRIAIPRAANNNTQRGHTFNISVMAPNTGNARKDRATALQQAAMVREHVATVTRKGA